MGSELPVVGSEEVGWEWEVVKEVEDVGVGLIRGILKRLEFEKALNKYS